MKQSFEHSTLEQEIKNLSLEIKERGLAEKGKQAVKTLIQEKFPVSSAPVPAPGAPASDDASHLPGYFAKESPQIKMKVEKLLDLALHHGIKRAADEARKMSPIEMDAFHDALTDKLYAELKTRGLLQ